MVVGDQGNITEPMGSWWSPYGAHVFWWSGNRYNDAGIGFTWRRHSRNFSIAADAFYNGRIAFVLADGHAKVFEGSFGTQYVNTDICFDSPGSPYPVMSPN